jgi:hypothetical protein
MVETAYAELLANRVCDVIDGTVVRRLPEVVTLDRRPGVDQE